MCIRDSVNVDSSEVNILGYDEGNRLRLFSYRDSFFTLNLSPILGLKIGSRDSEKLTHIWNGIYTCLLYTSPSPRDRTRSRMPSSA